MRPPNPPVSPDPSISEEALSESIDSVTAQLDHLTNALRRTTRGLRDLLAEGIEIPEELKPPVQQ
jgi:hypothetical protein